MLDTRARILIAALLAAIFGLIVLVIRMANTPAPQVVQPAEPAIQTEAIETFIVQLTASAPVPTTTPRAASSPTTPVLTAISGTPGCMGLRFVRDVTIPDNTEMNPAQVFTKSWQVENTGTCAWKPGFRVVLIGGVAMGGSPFKVVQTVGPGGSIQVSIKMVAPTNQTGVVQGTWKLSDENGAPFGDYLSVVIVVKGRTPSTPSSTATKAP
ncbi:MAG TPA: NBR1-Ig-like domain-containing protein [Anaerolineales bacterium]|nr:NBR1-Ig-like domain-containing protein [Anaerolineales bacterium]